MNPEIIAHRGHSKRFPENTLIAFRKAVEAGADGIELDTHETTDRHIVLHHVFDLGKTNNGRGYIFDRSLQYLKKLDAGSWFDPIFAGEKIPTLREVFEALGKKTKYAVEMKASTIAMTDRILRLVQEYNLLSNVQFTSYEIRPLDRIKRMEPKATVGFIAPRRPEWMSQRIARRVIRTSLMEGEIDVLHAPHQIYDAGFVAEIKGRGMRAHFGLCDTREAIEKAVQLGADEFSTNDLELAVSMVKGLPAEIHGK